MPWNMQDYPNSLKNFDELTRKKIIDIANALEANGYEEDRAIPIAIDQGKEWMAQASDAEKAQLKNATAPKKNDYHDSSSSNPDLLDNDVTVYYEDEKWWVKTVGAKQASESFTYKADAKQRAQEIADNRNSKVISYTKDGKKQ